MNGEIFFRRAVFGGFNREDVMQYISTLSNDGASRKKSEEALLKANEEIASLKAELEQKNETIDRLNAAAEELNKKIEELEALEPQPAENEEQPAADGGANRLMLESITYADNYVKSAGDVAKEICRDTALRAENAGKSVDELLGQIEDAHAKIDAVKETLLYFDESFERIKDCFTSEAPKPEKPHRQPAAQAAKPAKKQNGTSNSKTKK